MLATILLALATFQAPPITCKAGPVEQSFGGAEWLVYACSDARSILARAKPGSPADPFYFIVAAKGEAYELYGEGTGEQAVTDAAYADLQKLQPAAIARLHAAAVAAGQKP